MFSKVVLSAEEFCKYLIGTDSTLGPSLRNKNKMPYAVKLAGNGMIIGLANDITGEVIGVIAGYFNAKEGGTAFISFFHVIHKYRGQGFGRLLFGLAVDEAGKARLPTIELKVNRTNSNAINFYKHLGFEINVEESHQFTMKFLCECHSNS